jgi:hypothetical protein
MANQPIISIPIDDSAFRKFYEMFKAYSEKLETMPEAWKKLNATMGENGSAKVSDLLAIAATQTTAIVTAISGAADAQKRLGQETVRTTSSWDRLGKSVTGVASSVVGIGKAIAGWGLGAGALAGIGGGLGVADLANSVLNNQLSAGGLGLSIGQMRSWQTSMSPFVGTNLLQGAASAQLSPSMFGYLATLGISGQQAQGESPAQLATQIANAARQAYQQNPNINSAQAQAFLALGGTEADWRNLGTANGGFLRGSEASALAGAGAQGPGAQATRAFQGLAVALHSAENTVQSALIDALGTAAPIITKFTEAASSGIAAFLKSPELQADIKSLTDWLSSPAFMADLSTFGAAIKTAGADIMAFISWFSGKGGVPGAPAQPTPPMTPAQIKAAQNQPGLAGLRARLPIALGGYGNGAAGIIPNRSVTSTDTASGTNFAHVMGAFKAAGYSTNFAAAMAAQASSESSFNGASYNVTNGQVHAGMFGWSATRRAQIKKATGIDVWTDTNPDDQIKASIWELHNTQAGAAAKINAAANVRGPGAAGIAADEYYEGSGDNVFRQGVRGLKANLFAHTGPQSDLPASVKKLLSSLRTPPAKVSLNITNSTSARVAVSANSAVA